MEIALSQKLIVRVRSLMTESQMYKDSNLRLESLADFLGTSSSTLSKAINKFTGKTFNNYVNEFRIKEAVRLISCSQRDIRFVHGFYKEVGFQSRSSFYRTFKKIMGVAPAEFKRRKLLKSKVATTNAVGQMEIAGAKKSEAGVSDSATVLKCG